MSPTSSPRFFVSSLRWKILGWFFVNLAVVAAVLFGFLRAQFGLGIDSLLAGPTGDRLEAIARPLAAELRRLPPGTGWNEALTRAVGPYLQNGETLRAGIVGTDGEVLAGDLPAMPPEVRRVASRPPGGGGDGHGPPPDGRDGDDRPPPPKGPYGPPPEGFPPPFVGGPRQRGGPPPPPPNERDDGPPTNPAPGARMRKFMLGTASPRLYWAGVFLGELGPTTPPADGPPGPEHRAALVLASTSLRGGGLFFDYAPWLTLGGGLTLLSVLLWLPFVGRLTGGLTAMTRTAEGIAEGDFRSLPPTRPRRDELGRLGRALGHMAARLEALITGQKRFLGDTAHELLSPLGRLEVSLSILEQRVGAQEQAVVERALGEVHHLAKLVREILSLTKNELGAQNAPPRPVALLEIARRAVRQEAAENKVLVNVPGELFVLGNPDLLVRAVANTVRNAVRYAGHAGPITVSGAPATDAPTAALVLTVADEGPGVPKDALERLFDPFFRPEDARTRETGGTGLGLAIVKSCVESCGGQVSAQNRTSKGLAIVFRLPRATGSGETA